MGEAGPVFLAGIDRSGIGLLGELLEAHPQIAVSRRTNFWLFYDGQYGPLSDAANLDRCLAAMTRSRRIADLQPDVEALKHEFEQGAASYERLFALLQEQHMRRLGKSRWVDKSLNSEGYARRILEAYATAKMIHVLRDPRDRYVSQATHRRRPRGKIGAGAWLWLWSVQQLQRNLAHYSGRYKVVHYEALVRDPETVLREVCAFIGEPYSPAMLTVEAGAEGSGERGPRRFWTTSIGRYAATLSRAEIRFMQDVAGEEMARYGYRLAPQTMGPAEGLRYWLLDYPRYRLYLFLARIWSALRHRLPQKPPARRLRRSGAKR